MIETKDLEGFMKCRRTEYSLTPYGGYCEEIIKRLRAYDRICHDLKQLIATLSNEVDE